MGIPKLSCFFLIVDIIAREAAIPMQMLSISIGKTNKLALRLKPEMAALDPLPFNLNLKSNFE